MSILLVALFPVTLRAQVAAGGYGYRYGSPPPVAVNNSPFAARSVQQTPHPAVVRIIAQEANSISYGSGTLVDVNDQHGLIITNWHVVKDAPNNLRIEFPDGFQSTGQVLMTDETWDLAAVLIKRPNASPVRVSGAAPQVGEPLTIAGYGSGSYRAASGRCVQYLAPIGNQPFELVELSAAARQGDSGGPILNSRGELAGVLFGEAQGRTTGSYCGRVHTFLISVSGRVPAAASTELIASRPAVPASSGMTEIGSLPAAAQPNPISAVASRGGPPVNVTTDAVSTTSIDRWTTPNRSARNPARLAADPNRDTPMVAGSASRTGPLPGIRTESPRSNILDSITPVESPLRQPPFGEAVASSVAAGSRYSIPPAVADVPSPSIAPSVSISGGGLDSASTERASLNGSRAASPTGLTLPPKPAGVVVAISDPTVYASVPASTESGDESSATAEASGESPADSAWNWKTVVGTTPLEHVKTGFAGFGVLGIVWKLARIPRRKQAGQTAKKRGKKQSADA